MHPLKAYIKEIRLQQVKRELAALGVIYAIAISFVAIILSKIALVSLSTFNSQLIFCMIWSAVVSTIHISRRDLLFLQRTQNSSFSFLFADYILLSLLPILLMLFCQAYLAAGIIIAVAFIMCFIPPVRKLSNKQSSEIKFVPYYLPEWKSGIRKINQSIFYGLILLAIAASPLPFFSLFLCWIFTAIIAGFYQQFEPRDQLRFQHRTARIYLHDKIRLAVKSFLLILLPILILYTLFHPDQWVISLVALILFLILIVFSIVAKYSYYAPGATAGPHQIYFTLGILSLFIPFLVPIPLVLTITRYRKAIKRLSPYFYVTD